MPIFYRLLQGVLLDARASSSTPIYRKARLSAWSVLQTIFIALALTGVGAATAAEVKGDGAGAADTNATGTSSEKAWPARLEFDLDKLDLNIYGLAYHPDRERVKRDNLDNEFNPGLGLHYEFRNTERGVTFAEIGAYRDSGRNVASFLSLGYQFKIGENLRFGGAVAAMNSKTYNDGVAFIGMFPLITYDFGPVKANLVYFPKVANYNEVAAFGFYISVPLGRWVGDSVQKR
jgi:hypothetical protein